MLQCLSDAVVPTEELLLPFCTAGQGASGQGNTPNTLQKPSK